MATKKQKVHGVIHTAALAAAGVGAGLAQLPGSDMPVLCGIQGAMILAIAELHGASLTRAGAAKLLLTLLSPMVGRRVSSLAVSWIPGLGNAFNALTAAGLTESIGWAAHAFFADPEQSSAKRRKRSS